MEQHLVIILAVGEDNEQALAKHDRCAKWVADRGWIIRKRIIIDGPAAADAVGIRQAVIDAVAPLTADILVMESLNELGGPSLDVAELLEHLPKKGVGLHALKEAPDAMTPMTQTTAMLGAVCPSDEHAVVFAGPSYALPEVRKRAATLGWDLLVPRAKAFEKQLQAAPDRMLVTPSAKIFGKTAAQRARALTDLIDAGRRVFILDMGLDSAAPNARECLLALLSMAPQAQPTIEPTRSGERPLPMTVLSEWAKRKRKVVNGSIGAYIRESGYASSRFFKILHETAEALAVELTAILSEQGKTEAAPKHYQQLADRYNLLAPDLEYALRWYESSAKRSHSSGNVTLVTEG